MQAESSVQNSRRFLLWTVPSPDRCHRLTSYWPMVPIFGMTVGKPSERGTEYTCSSIPNSFSGTRYTRCHAGVPPHPSSCLLIAAVAATLTRHTLLFLATPNKRKPCFARGEITNQISNTQLMWPGENCRLPTTRPCAPWCHGRSRHAAAQLPRVTTK